jgi:hypothetical protein
MTLEQYAFLADIIGVLLVVASLVYVAQQLRQNTDMMRVSASDARVQRDFDIVSNLIDSRDLAEIWVKGGSQFETLDEVDKQRAMFFEYRAILTWHHVFSLRQKNLYSDEDWRWNEWVIQNLGRREAVRAAWQVFGGAYEKPFRDYVEGQFEIADRAISGPQI